MATTARIATQSVELTNNVTPMELGSVSVAGRVPTLAVTHVSHMFVSCGIWLFFRQPDLCPWLGVGLPWNVISCHVILCHDMTICHDMR